MNRRSRTALALAGVLALAACAEGSASGGRTLDVDAFAELADSPGVVVLDVRTPDEFASGHIPGAVNIDVSAPDFAGRVDDLDAEASYAVYCRTGNRSATAMQIMLDAGIESVAHLGGGVVAWAEAGGELTAP
jgi:phage shock protein E